MIHALGVPTDSTFLHFLHVTRSIEPCSVQATNILGLINEGDWEINVGANAYFSTPQGNWVIQPQDSIYCRIPNLGAREASVEKKLRWDNFVSGFTAYSALHKGIVINRAFAGAHNGAKPLHEKILSDYGFSVPEALTSAQSEYLRAFCADGPTIIKTISGTRAKCLPVGESDFLNYDSRRGPVHLQRRIYGPDLRAHVVDDRVFPLLIDTSHVDYRDLACSAQTTKIDLEISLEKKLIEVTREIGLVLAGWDFKIDAEKKAWVLEVNPMPGYDGYDALCNYAISRHMIATLKRGQG